MPGEKQRALQAIWKQEDRNTVSGKRWSGQIYELLRTAKWKATNDRITFFDNMSTHVEEQKKHVRNQAASSAGPRLSNVQWPKCAEQPALS
jgi:hypothetical protein